MLMTGLGALAVLLIGTGIAAPQFTYASDANEYLDVVTQLNDVREQTSVVQSSRAALDLLLNKRQVEAATIASRLQRLAAGPGPGPEPELVISAAVRGSLATDAAALESALPERAVQPNTVLVGRLDAVLADPAIEHPVSWFAVSPVTMGDLAGVQPQKPQSVRVEKRVTRDVLGAAQLQLREEQGSLEASRKDAEDSKEQLESLTEALDGALRNADALAASLPEATESLVAGLPELDTSIADQVRAAAAAAQRSAESTEFVRVDNGVVIPAAEAPGASVSGAAVLELDPPVRSILALGRLEAYVSLATTTVATEEARITAEQEQLEREQLEREEQERIARAAEVAAQAIPESPPEPEAVPEAPVETPADTPQGTQEVPVPVPPVSQELAPFTRGSAPFAHEADSPSLA